MRNRSFSVGVKQKRGEIMKKALSVSVLVALLLFAAVFSSSTLALQSSEVGEVFYGFETHKDLYNYINFNDIDNHWAKESILRSSGLSIIKGMGNNKFYPNSTLTREQAIILLVRLIGLEESAQKAGEALVNDNDTGNYIILDHNSYWSKGYIQVALNENILTQDEIDKITSFTYDEEEDIKNEVEDLYDYYFNDYSLTNGQLNNIYDELTDKIEYKYSWQKPVEREQVAVWVYRALGLNPIYSDNQHKVYAMQDYEEIDTVNIPIIEAILQKGIMSGDTQGFFNPNSSITRGEMAKLLDNISSDFLLNRGFKIGTGVVEKIVTQAMSQDGVKYQEKQFAIKNDDNSLINIITEESTNPLYQRGFVGLKDGDVVLPEAIEEEDYIRYYISPDDEVVFVEVLSRAQYIKEGFVEEIDEENNIIIISDYDDNRLAYKISPGASISVNDRFASLSDLLYGIEVTIGIDNGDAIYIRGYLSEGEEGYIPPGGRILFGKVLEIDLEDNILRLVEDEGKEEFQISVNTTLMKNNNKVTLSDIMEGDMLRLEFDTYNGNTPSKVYVSSPSKQIERLLKAKLNRFNSMKNELLLTDISYYEYGAWKEELGDMKLTLSGNADVYVDGIKITKEKLNEYIGKELYLATDNNYSQEEAIKLVIKNDFERKYYNKLQNITYGDNKLRVDYVNMIYNDGTIIVRDGRLIHPYNLKLDEELLVFTQGNSNMASIVSVETPNPMKAVLYKGKVRDIYQYSFDLSSVYRLSSNKWSYRGPIDDFQLSEETSIIDTRDEQIENVTVEQFTNSRFFSEFVDLDDQHQDDNYEGEYIYAIEYDNMILVIDIMNHLFNVEIISSAKVESIDLQMNTIKLKALKDWSDFREKWNINTTKIDLDVENAVIVKNGKRAKLDDLSPDDSLYIIRKDSIGYIVIAE